MVLRVLVKNRMMKITLASLYAHRLVEQFREFSMFRLNVERIM